MTKKEAVLSEWFFKNCFLLYFRVGFAQFIVLQGLLLDIYLFPSFSGHSFMITLGKLEFLHALSQSASISQLTPPFMLINFAFADTTTLRDQKAHMWNVWDSPTWSKSHPNVRQDSVYSQTFWYSWTLNPLTCFFFWLKHFYFTNIFTLLWEEILGTATIMGGNCLAI